MAPNDPPPGAPVTLRQLGALCGVEPRVLKERLQRRERATGEQLLFRHVEGGKLFSTVERLRAVFGEAFGRPTVDPADLVALEKRVGELRRDLNATIARQREFQRLALALFHEKR